MPVRIIKCAFAPAVSIAGAPRVLCALAAAAVLSPGAWTHATEAIRFATFNASLYGSAAGDLVARLEAPGDSQASAVAEIIQRVRPDVLLINEFDFDEQAAALDGFQKHYLAVGQNRSQSPDGPAEAVDFEYRYLAKPNTGIHSGRDLDQDGRVEPRPGSRNYGGDCWGFGRYPGQYGMVLLSRFPIDEARVRTFRKFLWKDMPDARLPDNADTATPHDWYPTEILEVFRLSSKSHWDLPIKIGDRVVHVLAAHPTPPVFDGAEDRNGRRNHDEIRFWLDYVTPGENAYIYDDQGKVGGLDAEAKFVIMGDLNGDPHDGEGSAGIAKLLRSTRVSTSPTPASAGAEQQATLQGGANAQHGGDPRYDTLDAKDQPGPGNLRLDYVIPESGLKTVATGVFWPKNDERLFPLVGTHPFPSSDHRLVWIDVALNER